MNTNQMPSFMSATEAEAVLGRLCPALKKGELASDLLMLVTLFVSWEYERPSLELMDSVLMALPDYIQSDEALPLHEAQLLAIRPSRVAVGRESIRDDGAVLSTLSQAESLRTKLFQDRTTALQSVLEGVSLWRTVTLALNLPSSRDVLPAVRPQSGPSVEAAKPAAAPETFQPGFTLELYKKVDVSALWRLSATEDANANHRKLLAAMDQGSPFRPLTQVPDLSRLDALQERFPHFGHVVASLRRSLALASMGSPGKAVVIPPLLLRGPPGTGKSYFAQQLAQALSCVYEERDLSVTTEAFVLTGMDPSWKYGKPGVVFDALVRGSTANPLICLNEVDKAKEGGANNSPIQALYSLLEPANSVRFKDEFVGVPVDASRIIWVLTANDGPIPEPILTRVELFDIPYPSPAQCQAIAQSVWADLLTKAFPPGHPFEGELSAEVCEEVSHVSPRVMRRALYAAAGLAALQGRNQLTLADVKASCAAPQDSKPRIGFI